MTSLSLPPSWEQNRNSLRGGICNGWLLTHSRTNNSSEGIGTQKVGGELQRGCKTVDHNLVGGAGEQEGASDVSSGDTVRSDTF